MPDRDIKVTTRGPSRCDGCGLTPALCLCPEVPVVAVRTRVVLLMHHVERRKTTNTGLLALRALRGAELRLRGTGADHRRPPLPAGRRLLLYPDPSARLLLPSDAAEDVVLIVPDGNWNQARRMARRDPDAAGAELVSLPPGDATRYALRRNPRPGTLSTLEAIARALGVLEGPVVEEQLLALHDRFVARGLVLRHSGKGGDAAAVRDRRRSPRSSGAAGESTS